MFTEGFGSFVCDGDTITCEVDGFTVTARIERDHDGSRPDQRDDSFYPRREDFDSEDKFDTAQELAEEIMQAWKADDWWYVGVCVRVSKAGVQLTEDYANSLWGVEANYPADDNSYLTTVANQLLPEALDDARAILAKLCA